MSFFDIIGLVFGLIAQIADFIIKLFAFLVKAVFAVLNFFFNLIVSNQKFNFAGFGRVQDFLKRLWREHVRVFIFDIYRRLKDLKDKLAAALGRITKILRTIRDIQDRLFNRFLFPILNVIQRVRQALFVFRLLGFKFAKKLDEKLFNLESRIARAFLDIRARLNLNSAWINFILDPQLFLNQFVFIRSLGRAVGAISNAIQRARLGVPPPANFDDPPGFTLGISRTLTRADIQAFRSTQPGTMDKIQQGFQAVICEVLIPKEGTLQDRFQDWLQAILCEALLSATANKAGFPTRSLVTKPSLTERIQGL